MMPVVKTIDYEDFKKAKRFNIEPSRRGSKKRTDPEQLRIFCERQKRLIELWRKMGVVSFTVLELPDDYPPDEAGVNLTKCRVVRTCSVAIDDVKTYEQ